MNTIANWSDENIYRMDKTPYTATIYGGGRQLGGQRGLLGQVRRRLRSLLPGLAPQARHGQARASRPAIPGASATSSTTN